MTLFEQALLVAIIVLLICLFVKRNPTAAQVVLPAAPAPAIVPPQAFTPEARAMSEDTEFFQTCDMQIGSPLTACDCNPDSNFEYATNNFGVANNDFTSWAMAESVDPAVVANHKEFVKDRVGEASSVQVLGRTYTPEDSHQSYTPPNSWIGIRGRPSRVPVCSPDQINDVNYGYYPEKQKLKWDSTSTYNV